MYYTVNYDDGVADSADGKELARYPFCWMAKADANVRVWKGNDLVVYKHYDDGRLEIVEEYLPLEFN